MKDFLRVITFLVLYGSGAWAVALFWAFVLTELYWLIFPLIIVAFVIQYIKSCLED